MTEEIRWGHPGEESIVRAVHEALRCRYGRIASENSKNPAAMKKRMAREYERLRLAFAGSKTVDTLRHALTDLWSRGGSNNVLKELWPQVLPMLASNKWQLTRDLALLALASYQAKEKKRLISSTLMMNQKEQKKRRNRYRAVIYSSISPIATPPIIVEKPTETSPRYKSSCGKGKSIPP